MSSKRYPFPMHPPELYPLFTGLCAVLNSNEILVLREKVVETARAIFEHNQLAKVPDVSLSYRLAEACHALLDRYDTLDPRAKALAIGAIRYYMMRRDVHCDTKPEKGWDDDLAVMNYVLEELGITSHFVG